MTHRALGVAAVALAVFAAGVALGLSLQDRSTDPVPAVPQVGAALPTLAPMPATAALFHFPYRQMIEFTADGAAAGAAMARTLTDLAPQGCQEARAIWTRIIPTENFGGEYGALDWLCGYLTASSSARKELGRDPDGRRLVAYLDRAGWKQLVRYLQDRYTAHDDGSPSSAPLRGAASPSLSLSELLFLHELLRFAGPQRPGWEHTDAVLDALGFSPGETVADVGAGHGYLSLRLSAAVGPGGKVYAAELDPKLVSYLDEIVRAEGRTNIVTVQTSTTDLALPRWGIDTVLICNLYHEVYGTLGEADRRAFVASAHEALRPGGRLIISDNTPEGQLPAGILPYQGFSISPELIILQLEASGFALERRFAIIPQRYQLVFRRT